MKYSFFIFLVNFIYAIASLPQSFSIKDLTSYNQSREFISDWNSSSIVDTKSSGDGVLSLL